MMSHREIILICAYEDKLRIGNIKEINAWLTLHTDEVLTLIAESVYHLNTSSIYAIAVKPTGSKNNIFDLPNEILDFIFSLPWEKLESLQVLYKDEDRFTLIDAENINN